MGKTVSIAEARHDLAALVHQAETGDAIAVTRRGRPVAMLISAEEYRRLHESKRADVWEAWMAWRTRFADDLLADNEPDPFADVRDRSPGREPPDFSRY